MRYIFAIILTVIVAVPIGDATGVSLDESVEKITAALNGD